jgi:DNA-binding MarR family transcriptional regulator
VYILVIVAVQPAPSQCVCASLRMAARAVSRHYDRALAPAGITVTTYSILARLKLEGPLPLGALAGRLAMDRTTLSREANPLIAFGLVDVAPDERDARRRVLSLSEAGAARLAAARPLWEAAQAELTGEFGADRTAGLVRELHGLVGAG